MRRVTTSCPQCGAEVEMSVGGGMFGTDADGNRGEYRDEAEVYDMPCGCELSDSEHERLCAAAIEKNRSDEESAAFEPDEVEGVAI